MGKLATLDRADRGWSNEGRDLLRGIAAGSIFGMPLLYTMEVWFHGASFSTQHLLTLLSAILVFNFLFSVFAGVRAENSGFNILAALADAITSVAIGVLIAVAVLAVIGRLAPNEGWSATIGRILIEACAVSIGVSFANSKFKAGAEDRDGDEDEDENTEDEVEPAVRQLHIDLKDLAATGAGALVFAFNVAPTEELSMLGASLSPIALAVLLTFEVGLCYVILFASGFKKHEPANKTVFQSAWAETGLTVAVSLLISAGLLYLIGESGPSASPDLMVRITIALGLPAVVGGAAGRLVI